MTAYILNDEGEPVRVSLLAWAEWFNDHDQRVVLQDYPVGHVMVSTVFLGLDHRFFGDGPPVLWETMIFGGPFDEWQWRYTSRLDALRGHASAVALVDLFAVVPRRTKKALAKFAAHTPVRPGEVRRLERALLQVGRSAA